MSTKVLLDTNFFLIPSLFNVDIFTEFQRILPPYHLFILDKSINELNNIINTQKGKNKQAAKMALSIIKKYKIKIIKTEKHINETKSTSTRYRVDDLIIDFAVKNDYIVATQDKEIKKKLKKQNKKIITLRQKKYLIII